jgi:hypothetical protein
MTSVKTWSAVVGSLFFIGLCRGEAPAQYSTYIGNKPAFDIHEPEYRPPSMSHSSHRSYHWPSLKQNLRFLKPKPRPQPAKLRPYDPPVSSVPTPPASVIDAKEYNRRRWREIGEAAKRVIEQRKAEEAAELNSTESASEREEARKKARDLLDKVDALKREARTRKNALQKAGEKWGKPISDEEMKKISEQTEAPEKPPLSDNKQEKLSDNIKKEIQELDEAGRKAAAETILNRIHSTEVANKYEGDIHEPEQNPPPVTRPDRRSGSYPGGPPVSNMRRQSLPAVPDRRIRTQRPMTHRASNPFQSMLWDAVPEKSGAHRRTYGNLRGSSSKPAFQAFGDSARKAAEDFVDFERRLGNQIIGFPQQVKETTEHAVEDVARWLINHTPPASGAPAQPGDLALRLPSRKKMDFTIPHIALYVGEQQSSDGHNIVQLHNIDNKGEIRPGRWQNKKDFKECGFFSVLNSDLPVQVGAEGPPTTFARLPEAKKQAIRKRVVELAEASKGEKYGTYWNLNLIQPDGPRAMNHCGEYVFDIYQEALELEDVRALKQGRPTHFGRLFTATIIGGPSNTVQVVRRLPRVPKPNK